MDFAVSPPIHDLAPAARRVVDEQILPLERTVLEQGFGAAESGDRGAPRAAAARGPARPPHMPREWGGAGLSLLDFATVGEVLGRSVIGHYVFNVQAPDAGNMELLLHHGTPEQKERWLAPAGRRRDPQLLRHDRAGVRRLEPRPARHHRPPRDGDDYVIDGHKWFTSAADGAAFCIVMAVTNPEAAKPHARASQILVPTDTPGFEIVQNLAVMGERGEGWMSHAEVRLDRRPRAGSPTASAPRARGSPSPRSGWGPGASTTACAGSASASAPST